MIQPRQIIGTIALVLASLGPIPSWLHHTTVHSVNCGTLHSSGSLGCAESTCHGHGAATSATFHRHGDTDGEEPAPNAEDQLNGLHDHDCAVCFQLAQSSSPPSMACIDSGGELVLSKFLASKRFYLFADENPHRPRGPPGCEI